MAKHHKEEHEHEEHKHGGHVGHKGHKGLKHGKHHGKHAAGGKAPAKADGNPFVVKEAEAGHNIGKIGGVKGKTRLDRKCGGAAHHKHGGHAHHDGMPKVHTGEGGVAHHHTHGGHHHRASGGGADSSPYSSAGIGLRHKSGGHA
jgi:hypothetical protein